MRRMLAVLLGILALCTEAQAVTKIYRVQVNCNITLAQQIDNANLTAPRPLYEATKMINISDQERSSCRPNVNIILVYPGVDKGSFDQFLGTIRSTGLVPATAQELVALADQYPSLSQQNLIAPGTLFYLREMGQVTSYFMRSRLGGVEMVDASSLWPKYTLFVMKIQ